jgi:hypothetical protein
VWHSHSSVHLDCVRLSHGVALRLLSLRRHGYINMNTNKNFYLCTTPLIHNVLVWAGFGLLWAVLPALCAELYGLDGLGGIYNMLNFAPMLGSLALATGLAPNTLKNAQREEARVGFREF